MISSNNPLPMTLNSSGTYPTKNPSNSRRIIRCLIELNRPGEARDYLPQIKETPLLALTLVLQFQVCLRGDDEALGTFPLSSPSHADDSHKSTWTTHVCARIHPADVVSMCLGHKFKGRRNLDLLSSRRS